MSISFKITIPSGELCDHIKGRDPKSRNFELNRLATNALLMNYQNNQAGVINEEAATLTNSKRTTKEVPNTDDSKQNEEYSAKSQSKIANKEEQLMLEIGSDTTDNSDSDGFVDFGDDILSV